MATAGRMKNSVPSILKDICFGQLEILFLSSACPIICANRFHNWLYEKYLLQSHKVLFELKQTFKYFKCLLLFLLFEDSMKKLTLFPGLCSLSACSLCWYLLLTFIFPERRFIMLYLALPQELFFPIHWLIYLHFILHSCYILKHNIICK